eukprot:380702_1
MSRGHSNRRHSNDSNYSHSNHQKLSNRRHSTEGYPHNERYSNHERYTNHRDMSFSRQRSRSNSVVSVGSDNFKSERTYLWYDALGTNEKAQWRLNQILYYETENCLLFMNAAFGNDYDVFNTWIYKYDLETE